MRAARIALSSACLVAAGALLAACGGGGGTSDAPQPTAPTVESQDAPPKSAFEATAGRTLGAVIRATDKPAELLVEPEALAYYEGANRYPFSIRERKGPAINDAEVAIYMAKVPPLKGKGGKGPRARGALARARQEVLDEPALGPFPARIESLATDPKFRSETVTGEEPAAAVYVSDVDFPSDGEWRMAAVIKEGDETSAALLSTAEVGLFKSIPRPGDKAPLIHTPTAEDVGGDLSKITTRTPPDTQNEVDYAEALGKEPILLLFATPKFCQSRVCGPVVDVAEQAKAEHGDEAAFIHMEIYNDNDPSAEVRPQVRAFHLPTEPWLFAINSDGVVSSTVEGAFGPELMERIVNKVVSE